MRTEHVAVTWLYSRAAGEITEAKGKNRGFPDWGWQNYPFLQATPTVWQRCCCCVARRWIFCWRFGVLYRVDTHFCICCWMDSDLRLQRVGIGCFRQRIFCLPSCRQWALEQRGPPMTSPIGFVRIKENKTWRSWLYALQFGCALVCLCNRSSVVTIVCWHVQPLASFITAQDLRVGSSITETFSGMNRWMVRYKRYLGNDSKWVVDCVGDLIVQWNHRCEILEFWLHSNNYYNEEWRRRSWMTFSGVWSGN